MMMEPRPVVGLTDAGAAEDRGAGRKIRPGNDGDQVLGGNVRMVDERDAAVDHLAEVMGGMLVAMPTAMPPAPLTSRFGKRAGRTDGSCFDSS